MTQKQDRVIAGISCSSLRERTMMNRRDLLKTTIATAGALATGSATSSPAQAAASGIDILRKPDLVEARTEAREILPLHYEAKAWTVPGTRIEAEPQQTGGHLELPVFVESTSGTITHIHLRWRGNSSESQQVLGDAWERSYGELGWQHTDPHRVMPWYFLATDGNVTRGYGVMTQAAALCFWQCDPEGISLWIDIRNGGNAVQLGARRLKACTVIAHTGAAGQPMQAAARAFCQRMCPNPRLPKQALFGANDWNYAYGKNTADGILRDADLIASLAPAGNQRPQIVIDDGWQDPKRFPDLPALAASLKARKVQPGIWIRPLRASSDIPSNLLLPQQRFGPGSSRHDLAFDPTIPQALEHVLDTARQPVSWGYSFLKHDFSTYELFGRWGFEMGANITAPGWHFNDRSRTNAEIVNDLYRNLRHAAGDDTTVLACNTIGHLAAGVFESQRTGDDTSGRDWERTRRMGVNTLAHRIAQHRTFFHADPDIVALTKLVPWRLTQQWMDVVARSGASLFLAPSPDAIDAEAKAAIRDAMALVVASTGGYPVDATRSTTPQDWTFNPPGSGAKSYRWMADGASPFST
jgi:alpha-galactosidase